MSRRRALVFVFLMCALLLAAVAHAWHRFTSLSEQSRERIATEFQSSVSRFAARLEDAIELGRRNALYLSSRASMSALATHETPENRELANSDAAAILHHFPSFGAVCLYHESGRELLRVERMGGGIGIVPSGLLDNTAELLKLRAALAANSGTATATGLERDSSRVEVREEDRLVLRYWARLDTSPPSVLALSLYASPILQSLSPTRLPRESTTLILDREGSVVYCSPGLPGTGRQPSLILKDGELLPEPKAIVTSMAKQATHTTRTPDVWYLGASTGPRSETEEPLWRLVLAVPVASIRNDVDPIRSEALSIAAVFALTVIAVAGLGVLLMRFENEQRRVRTEREAEQRLLASERLATVGRLTAGVAHEINNPLAGIRNYLSLLSREGNDPGRRQEYIELVQRGIEKISIIVRDLLSFSTPPRPRIEETSLVELLEDVERVCRHDTGFRHIQWTREVEPGCSTVRADPYALEQVFLNLALNARDAIARSAGANNSRHEIRVRIAQAAGREGFVSIIFEDSGPGIAPEALPRIFEPFFTTRNTGTGLGLSISAAIIRAHGGEIEAGNVPEGDSGPPTALQTHRTGARFTILLPMSSGSNGAAPRSEKRSN